MRSELQKTEMEVGDIELVIAGVHWYLEWRKETEPKDSFEKHFTVTGFEGFVAKWNPNPAAVVTSGTAALDIPSIAATCASGTNAVALVAMVAIVFGCIFK
jgi:hypothetical protein